MLIIDRFEGDFAVCEQPGRNVVAIPLADLPPGVREGDCLRVTEEGYAVDAAETERRRQKNSALFDSLRDGDTP